MVYITTPTELLSVMAFMFAQNVNNVWFQLLSSNLAPFPQYYDDSTATLSQFSTLAAATTSAVALVDDTTYACKANSTSVGCCGFLQTYNQTSTTLGIRMVLDDCTINRRFLCKWTPPPPNPPPLLPPSPSPPPPNPNPPPYNAAAQNSYLAAMTAVMQMDYGVLTSNATKLAQFKIDYCATIVAALPTNKGCVVTGVTSSSVVSDLIWVNEAFIHLDACILRRL